jgi:predicted DNA binding CopG/RHH family protein
MTTAAYILDEEEQEILEFVEKGEWKNPPNFAELKRDLEVSAREHLKRKQVTIRLQTPLLRSIRAEATRLGIPYQTYIQSALTQWIRQEEAKNMTI